MSGPNRINPLLAKILSIALLTLLLLIPLWRVESLIAERAALRDSAVQRVANGVGRGAIFFLLATIMIGTRELDWYRVAESHRRGP
jgi:inner membrane protein involved in colicin E2 resistance